MGRAELEDNVSLSLAQVEVAWNDSRIERRHGYTKRGSIDNDGWSLENECEDIGGLV